MFSHKYSRVFLLATLFLTQNAGFFPWEYVLNNNQGIVKYNQKNFDKAEELFNNALADKKENIEIKYNLADTLYKKKKYVESQSLYLDILKNENTDGELKQKIHYNLGNILYRLGEQSNPELFWSNSIKEYERSLNINSKDKHAKENYDFVADKLKKLKPPPPKGGQGNPDQKQNNQNSGQAKPQIYSNSVQNSQQAIGENSGVTQAEADNILEELKDQEDNMQNYVNRRQASFENKQNNQKVNNLIKDW